MKKFNALLLLLIALLVFGCDNSGPGNGCGDTTVPQTDPVVDPQEPGVLLVGRFDQSDSAGPKASWTASTIKANFKGTKIAANLTSTGDNWFHVIIDDVAQTPINITPGTSQPVLLASGLTSGTHSIQIVKRTESYQGEMQFSGFTFPKGGNLLAPPAAADRRIEFIGDSITCGYGNEGASQYESFTTKNENAYLAYGSVTARLLQADHISIAASGKGVMRNSSGDTIDLMPELYPRTLPWDTDLIWDYTSWIPHAVVINLSTNDYNLGIPDRTEFTTAYQDLVNTVRTQYPDAFIYCALGPMLDGESLDSARDYISSVADELAQAGDQKVKFIEFPTQTEENGYGEDWHPSSKTHELMANQLAKEIQTDLGW